MADFDTARAALEAARRRAAAAQDALAAAQRASSRAQIRYDTARRTGDEGAADELAWALDRARKDEARQRQSSINASADARTKLGEFAEVADPRTSITAWPDETPVLLLPVRLETRFKRVDSDGTAHDELWVRIYPDTCAVDNFEAALSDVEVESGRRFWIETWAAGGIEAQRRSAWRNLVSSHGIGRAAWIVNQYSPVNANALVAKGDPQDIVLVFATETLPTDDQRAALADYWKAIWVAPTSAEAAAAAVQTLAAAPDVTDAEQLIGKFAPANLAVEPTPPKLRTDVTLSIAWLQLPPLPDVKMRSWTAPARVSVLPDRFVVIGYQDGKPVFDASGSAIPSPLVAGPDPSAPAGQQLQQDEQGDLVVPADMKWMVDFESAVEVGMGIKIAARPCAHRPFPANRTHCRAWRAPRR